MHGVSKVQGKIRKRELAQACLINCDRCPYHRRENATRVPKSDKHKLIKRTTIRKMEICDGIKG